MTTSTPDTSDTFDSADVQLPEFNWDTDLTAEIAVNIARLGDRDMRIRLARHKSLTDAAGVVLVEVGDKEIAAYIRRNPVTTAHLFVLAAKTKRAARRANRRNRKQQVTLRRANDSTIERIGADL